MNVELKNLNDEELKNLVMALKSKEAMEMLLADAEEEINNRTEASVDKNSCVGQYYLIDYENENCYFANGYHIDGYDETDDTYELSVYTISESFCSNSHSRSVKTSRGMKMSYDALKVEVFGHEVSMEAFLEPLNNGNHFQTVEEYHDCDGVEPCEAVETCQTMEKSDCGCEDKRCKCNKTTEDDLHSIFSAMDDLVNIFLNRY